ncbi:MAG: lipopolysaccharide biosynthesis protein [Candidatus Thermoplasmatota archaeon]|nr:lipopolysaccharide biosynthesis protein [Euryarchaeota archaeon]MBU4031465.1 lipopolysaccharide biosynthesis protein [Candidatus Thermoplasmatota archaeon]MBU4070773.1 lipopolysaccharide biosynthesis protein [Candidatus Thermoplasmatota archaeon]MBU4144678.1 lipopolysaccharide biosynthesis protein [Candidatus Thermoplasmatota archaeon]MBU4592761.1 lipopolysaccharide biosynthesis protein [Candidatus Thermoplasmatota archaeon]
MGFISEKMNEARGRPVMMGASFLTAIFNTVALLLIARKTNPEILGTLGFLLAFMGLFLFVGDLGNGLAFERLLARGFKFQDCFKAFIMAKVKLTVAMGVISGAMIAVYFYLLAPDGYTAVSPVSMALILGYFIMVNLAAIWVVAMKLKKKRTAPNELIESLVKAMLVACMFWFLAPVGDQELVFRISFIYLIAATLGMMLVRNNARRLKTGENDEEIELEFQETASKFIPFIAFTALIFNLDKVALWLASDFHTLGLYFGAQRITVFIAAAAISIELLMGEALSRYIRQNRTAEISATLRMTERYASLVALPVTAFYVVFSHSLLQAFLGDNFAGAGMAVSLLAGAGLFTALASPHISYMLRADKFRELAIISGLGFAVFIGVLALLLSNLILPGADIHGMNGTALAMLASSAAIFVSARLIVWKMLDCKPHSRILVHFLCAGVMMAVMQFAIWYFSIELSFVWLISMAALGFFVYVLCLYLTGEMVRRDFHEFKKLTKPEE